MFSGGLPLSIMLKKHSFNKDTIINKKNLTIVLLNSIGYQKNVSLSRLVDHWIISKKFGKYSKKYKKLNNILLLDGSIFYVILVSFLAINNSCLVNLRKYYPALSKENVMGNDFKETGNFKFL